MEQLLPGIIGQLGGDNINSLRRMAEGIDLSKLSAMGMGKAAPDDAIPDLDANFEAVSKSEDTKEVD